MRSGFILSCESTIDLPYSYCEQRDIPVLFYSYQVDGVSYEDLYQRLLYGVDCPADQYLLLADFASYCAASHRVVDTYADREKWNRMSLHNIARSGIFSADRSIADYADTIWHVPYKK